MLKTLFLWLISLSLTLLSQSATARDDTTLRIEIHNHTHHPYDLAIYGEGDSHDYDIHHSSPKILPQQKSKMHILYKPKQDEESFSVRHMMIVSEKNHSCSVEYTTFFEYKTLFHLFNTHRISSKIDSVVSHGLHCQADIKGSDFLKVQVFGADEKE
ncbi:MAG TPA: hypothetical protein VJB02_00840 [Coxiellaceae bacterium]|nr:hypothetical protein [Coxiellaceae bacterium]